ncbi:MAG: hypothetical protein HDQ88_05770 [Clostridia bacterium]|nr:hypothetical protein [Clostridia bacterium]
MNGRNNLTFFILELVCGLTCIGFGIYYIVTAENAQAIVFMLVGALCIGTAIKTLITVLKLKKKQREDKNNDVNKE